TGYRCAECGWETAGYVGRCGECQQWNTLQPFARARTRPSSAASPNHPPALAAIRLSEVAHDTEQRISTGIPELDRVLGDGIVPGAAILVGGDPGIGKSTLVLQAAANVANAGTPVAYICGEESPR